MHAKTICIDGKLAFIGTVNMDIRSFFINFEIAAIIHDENICMEMQQQFEIDKEDSLRIDMKYWKKRPVFKRGLDSICRLMAPVL